MFEPFHPSFWIPWFKRFAWYYISPSENWIDWEKIKVILKNIYSWKIINSRFYYSNQWDGDRDNILIKDINHCICPWYIKENFSEIIFLIIIRNPFSVAYSKYKTREWWWSEKLLFLNQESLNKKLSIYLEYIKYYRKENDYIIKQVLIWCIYYRIILDDMKNTPIVFYEDLCTNYSNTILQIKKDISFQENRSLNFNFPTKVSEKTIDIFEKRKQLHEYKNYINDYQLLIWEEIIERFWLKNYYHKCIIH